MAKLYLLAAALLIIAVPLLIRQMIKGELLKRKKLENCFVLADKKIEMIFFQHMATLVLGEPPKSLTGFSIILDDQTKLIENGYDAIIKKVSGGVGLYVKDKDQNDVFVRSYTTNHA